MKICPLILAVKIAYKTINARVETVDTTPSYRQAFKKRRCLIPVMVFMSGRKFSAAKFTYSISMKDDSAFVFAGLWEGWKDPATDEWFRICMIITGDSNEFVRGDPYPDAVHPVLRRCSGRS